jgi:hypothetical protein
MRRSVVSLPPHKRAEHYREAAKEAVQKIQETFDKERRAELLAIASGWHALALDAERRAAGAVTIFHHPAAQGGFPAPVPDG